MADGRLRRFSNCCNPACCVLRTCLNSARSVWRISNSKSRTRRSSVCVRSRCSSLVNSNWHMVAFPGGAVLAGRSGPLARPHSGHTNLRRFRPKPNRAGCSIEIRTAHEVMTAGAAQFALFVVQFVTAPWTPAPVFAVLIGAGRAGVRPFAGRLRIRGCRAHGLQH